jgi:hypothetical protein
MEKTFTVNGNSYIYSFSDLPLSHIMAIEEIYFFKRAQIKRSPARFEDVVASGSSDYFVRAAAYLLLPLKEDGSTGSPDPKVVRRFVEGLTGEQVENLEECMRDFFSKRKRSDLESDVRSRDFLTLEELVSLGTKVQTQLSAAASNSGASSSPNTPPSFTPENSTEE